MECGEEQPCPPAGVGLPCALSGRQAYCAVVSPPAGLRALKPLNVAGWVWLSNRGWHLCLQGA